MSSRDTVVIHKNMVAGLRDLPHDIAGEVMIAFFAIRFDGADMSNYPPLVRFALSSMFATVDNFDQRFEATKAARAEAGRKSGEARRAKRDAALAEVEQTNKTNKTNKPQQNERVGVGVGVGVGEHLNTMPPFVGVSAEKTKAPSKKGSRWENETPLPDNWLDWAKEKTGHTEIGIRQQFERFSDYWVSQPGQKGVKLDWFATWRNWLRSPYNHVPAVQPQASEPSKPPIDWSQH